MGKSPEHQATARDAAPPLSELKRDVTSRMLFRAASFKVMLATSLILLLMLSASFVWTNHRLHELEYRQVADDSRRVADIVLQSFELADPDRRPVHTKYLTSRLVQVPGLHNIRVVDVRGQVRFSRNEEEIGRPIEQARDARCRRCHDARLDPDRREYVAQDGTPVYHRAYPIPNHLSCQRCHLSSYKELGTLVVEVDLTEVKEEMQEHLRAGLWTTAATLAGALVGVGLFFYRYIRSPLRTLVQCMNDGERGIEGLERTVFPGSELEEIRLAYLRVMRSLTEARTRLQEALRTSERGKAALDRELTAMYSSLIRMEHLSAIGTLSAQTAHEIRTPLNALGLNVQLIQRELRRKQMSEPGIERRLSSISAEVDRISHILTGLLERSTWPTNLETTRSLPSLFRDVVQFCEFEASQQHVTLDMAVSEDLPEVRVDPDQIRQVLINLIHNALHAQSGGGTIRLTAEPDGSREGGGILIRVQDDGMGISPEELPRIFEPFYTTRPHGTGLGLSIVRRIIDRHHGTIECRSTPGEGTEFRISLPAVAEHER